VGGHDAQPRLQGLRGAPDRLDIETYATGLLAAGRVPLELEQPEFGIAAFRRRFPDITEQHVRDS
jgi:hypothetical protein